MGQWVSSENAWVLAQVFYSPRWRKVTLTFFGPCRIGRFILDLTGSHWRAQSLAMEDLVERRPNAYG